jgi:hypothetical protein
MRFSRTAGRYELPADWLTGQAVLDRGVLFAGDVEQHVGWCGIARGSVDLYIDKYFALGEQAHPAYLSPFMHTTRQAAEPDRKF